MGLSVLEKEATFGMAVARGLRGLGMGVRRFGEKMIDYSRPKGLSRLGNDIRGSYSLAKNRMSKIRQDGIGATLNNYQNKAAKTFNTYKRTYHYPGQTVQGKLNEQ